MTPDQNKTVCDIVTRLAGTDDVLGEPDLDLFEADILDSMGMVELLFALEDQLGVVIPPTEVDRSDVATLNKILALVDEHL